MLYCLLVLPSQLLILFPLYIIYVFIYIHYICIFVCIVHICTQKVVKVVLIFTIFFAYEDFHFPGLINLRFFQCVSTSLYGFRILRLTISIPEMDSVVTFLWLFSQEAVFQIIFKKTFEDHHAFVLFLFCFTQNNSDLYIHAQMLFEQLSILYSL